MPKGIYKHKFCSIETKIKMSLIHKGQIPWNKGKKMPKGFGNKISEILKKRIRTDSFRQKLREANLGRKNHFWKGGKYLDGKGYILIYRPDHPFAVKGHIPEHRFIMEKYIGRILTLQEFVHHINHNRSDNRLKNLLLVDRHKHIDLHRDKITGRIISK